MTNTSMYLWSVLYCPILGSERFDQNLTLATLTEMNIIISYVFSIRFLFHTIFTLFLVCSGLFEKYFLHWVK